MRRGPHTEAAKAKMRAIALARNAVGGRIEVKDPIIRELFSVIVRRRITMKQLAEKTGYTRAVIEDARLNRVRPKFAFIRDLAEALGYELKLVPKETKK